MHHELKVEHEGGRTSRLKTVCAYMVCHGQLSSRRGNQYHIHPSSTALSFNRVTGVGRWWQWTSYQRSFMLTFRKMKCPPPPLSTVCQKKKKVKKSFDCGRKPEKNPLKHEENIQTPDKIPGPSCCEV